ncbi:MAG: hypothetical protein ABSA01_00005 [Anaerolineales bacterium]
MKKNLFSFLYAFCVLMPLAFVACTGQLAAHTALMATIPTQAMLAPTSVRITYTDPFAFCEAVGTINAPDSRYTGDPIPLMIIQGYLKAAGLENNGEPLQILQKSTIWRCMNKAVYVCNFGANLPCDSKADTDKNPTQPMQDFCNANPTADFIPMSVTGHTTIYSWGCVNNTPKLLKHLDRPDAAGYLSRIWYRLPPNP